MTFQAIQQLLCACNTCGMGIYGSNYIKWWISSDFKARSHVMQGAQPVTEPRVANTSPCPTFRFPNTVPKEQPGYDTHLMRTIEKPSEVRKETQESFQKLPYLKPTNRNQPNPHGRRANQAKEGLDNEVEEPKPWFVRGCF